MNPDPGILHKVRSLLAKAESTEFPEEAEALTAKAQDLMDRHAIDAALLAASSGDGGRPEGRDLLIETPYARPRFHLLHEVATANRCRAVWVPSIGRATVVGFPADRERVEVLYTSLLLQATTAMVRAGTTTATRSRSFRHSFLVAFSVRVGQRLAEAAAATVAQAAADHGSGLLPVLAGRDQAVEEAMQASFPHIRRSSVTANDPRGTRAGLAAADRARVRHDDQVSGARRPLPR